VVYRYDGQIGTEDDEMNPGGTAKSLTRSGLGARGIDVISRTTSSGNQVSYPLYDGHGNNVGSLLKNGAPFTVADEKTYDACGALRSGGGADKGKYCANLGHKQDDESGLVYMRARYYEPTSGRFVSEDTTISGLNRLAYCESDPANQAGSTEKIDEKTLATGFFVEVSEHERKVWDLNAVRCSAVRTGAGMRILAIGLINASWICDPDRTETGNLDERLSGFGFAFLAILLSTLVCIAWVESSAAGAKPEAANRVGREAVGGIEAYMMVDGYLEANDNK
jgi:RHS repeat-associated protein